jgi:hypothetical protein
LSLATDARRLAGRDLENDLKAFHLLRYGGRVDGFLVTAKNSGTHWLRYMASHAIAHHLVLPPPAFSSGAGSDLFIGHPKHDRVHEGAPRIGSSHNIPSRLIAQAVSVLVRDPRQALASYYAKWRDDYDLGTFSDFLRRPAPGTKKVDDIWWFIRFFNRWGELNAALPGLVRVVRHEEVKVDPGQALRQIWGHWGVVLTDGDVAAAEAVSSRKAVRRAEDPERTERVVSDLRRRDVVWTAEDEAFVAALFGQHLKYDFGYGLVR